MADPLSLALLFGGLAAAGTAASAGRDQNQTTQQITEEEKKNQDNLINQAKDKTAQDQQDQADIAANSARQTNLNSQKVNKSRVPTSLLTSPIGSQQSLATDSNGKKTLLGM